MSIEIVRRRLCLYGFGVAVTLTLQSCALADGNDDAELLTALVEGTSDSPPCERPRPRESADIRLTEQSFDCGIVILPPSVTLAAEDADSPAPGHRAVRLRGGRYVTEVGHASAHRLLLWDSTGALVTTYDRTGEGPGELTDRMGAYFLLTNPSGDTLYVVDGNNRWSVFTPDLEFVRSFQAKTVRSREGLAVTEDGLILSTAPKASRSRIQVFGLDGSLLREIGQRAPSDTLKRDSGGETIAYAGDGMVWTTRPPGLPGDLVLEQWTTDGVLKRTIRRPTPGIRSTGFQLDMKRDGSGDAHSSYVQVENYPQYPLVKIDQEGLLWVAAVVPDWGLREETSHIFSPQSEDDPPPLNVRLEVIDPDAGRVLASALIRTISDVPLDDILRGTSVSYRSTEDDLGFRTLVFRELRLASR